MAIDQFHRIRGRHEWTEREFLGVFQRTALGFHRAIAGMASAGNIVVDHVLGERWRLLDVIDVLQESEVFFIGVQCALPELGRRERERGNRTVGRAAVQAPLAHKHGIYDLAVDTGTWSAATCAQQIHEHVVREPEPTAFSTLRAELARDA